MVTYKYIGTVNMLKIVIILTLLLTGICQAGNAAQSEEKSASAPPISSYTEEVQEAARQLMDMSWLVNWRFKKVKSRLQYWQGLAEQCDDFSDESGRNWRA